MIRFRTIFHVAMATLLLGAPASAQVQVPEGVIVVAGWDFSQYVGASSNINDSTFVPRFVAEAQWSDYDTTDDEQPGMGVESKPFGTMYHEGSFGSDDTTGTAEFAASSANLRANDTAPVLGVEMSSLGAGNVLVAEGAQPVASDLSMQAFLATAVVFEADRTGTVDARADWQISFAAQLDPATGPSASIPIEFSTDGASYSSVGTVDIDNVDTQFVVPLGNAASDFAYARLGLPDGARIDNVAIQVPEPAAGVLCSAAGLGLATLRRRRAHE